MDGIEHVGERLSSAIFFFIVKRAILLLLLFVLITAVAIFEGVHEKGKYQEKRREGKQ